MVQWDNMTNIQYSEQLKFKPLKLQGSWEMESAKYRYVEESLDKELRVKIFDFPLHYNGPNTLMKC